MTQNQTGVREACDDPPTYPVCSAEIPFRDPIEIARRRRASDVQAMIAAMPGLLRGHPVAVAVASSIASVAAVIAYASLLSRTGAPGGRPGHARRAAGLDLVEYRRLRLFGNLRRHAAATDG
nr:hypothetical protein [uncultured Rhodopila sp.]